MSIRSKISATRNYASFFDYPLTQRELQYWLITDQVIPSIPQSYLDRFPKTLPPIRLHRRRLTQQKLKAAQPTLHLLSYLPTIELLALTGSLSMDNAQEDDDLDLMIVTTKNTLWLTRPLVLIILALLGKKRPPVSIDHFPNSLCVNLWLDTSSFAVPQNKHNLYIAHEVLQVKPLFNRHQTYETFITTNSWTAKYLANAYHHLTSHFSSTTNSSWWGSLSSFFLNPFNQFAFQLQYLYMKSKITREHITLHSAYFHPRDLSPKITKHLR